MRVGWTCVVAAIVAVVGPAASLIACSDGPTPHDVVDCDSTWGGRTTGCERACETMPVESDVRCDAVHDGYMGTLPCFRTSEFEGIRGCCVDNGPLPMRFFECL